MRTSVIFSALLASALLAGCGGGGGGSSTPATNPPIVQPGPGPTPTPTPAGASVSAPALGGSLTATLAEDVSGVAVGGTVNYTLTLANTSSAPVTVTADTTGSAPVPHGALRITDAGGATLYPPPTHPLDSPPAPPSSGIVTLQPGDKISRTVPLTVFSKAGSDQAVATFTVAASSADTPQSVTLSPLTVAVH